MIKREDYFAGTIIIVILVLFGTLLFATNKSDKNLEKKSIIRNNCMLENKDNIAKYQLDCIDRSSKSTGFLKTNSYIDKCQQQAIDVFCGEMY
jgi:hypothetical protein